MFNLNLMITNVLILLIGLILLVKGSDYFVKSASSIAKEIGVSEFVIGLTLVAVGTSIPELASSVAASLAHSSGIVIGNVIGSNIANIALIVGCATLLTVVKTDTEMLKRDGYIMMFAAVLFFIFAFDLQLSKIDAIILLLFYVAYIFFLFEDKTKYEGKFYFKEFVTYFFKFKYVKSINQRVKTGINKRSSGKRTSNILNSSDLKKDILTLSLSGIAVIFGAKYFVEEAIFFAQIFQIPDTFIGVTLVAVGTSLPELMVTVSAARKGYGNIAIGNVIGSNITNIFLILGISSLIFPLEITQFSITFTIPFMIFISLILLWFISTHWEIRKKEGITLILLYALFLGLLINITY
jgi:cation:H+ antiporter